MALLELYALNLMSQLSAAGPTAWRKTNSSWASPAEFHKPDAQFTTSWFYQPGESWVGEGFTIVTQDLTVFFVEMRIFKNILFCLGI